MQCMLCGCKFDLEEASKCECNCAFGGCGGQNVKCPNCGFDIPVPRELRPKNNSTIFNKLKSTLKM